ncbi:MAG: TIGR02611 family protein [Pseudonocardiales bacterium]|nr:TIGR02611 family protein [Pseudonocardiales bacterium]
MRDRLVEARARLDRFPVAVWIYRAVVGFVGVAVMVAGVVMLPAPGPGWAVIFVGLGILATEFAAARRVLAYVRRRYQQWVDWLGGQSNLVQVLVSGALLLLVVVCAWLVGAFELVGGWFDLDWQWLASPLSGMW